MIPGKSEDEHQINKIGNTPDIEKRKRLTSMDNGTNHPRKSGRIRETKIVIVSIKSSFCFFIT